MTKVPLVHRLASGGAHWRSALALSAGAWIAGLLATLLAVAAIAFLYHDTVKEQLAIARNLAQSISASVESEVASIDYVLQVAADDIERQHAGGQASFDSVTAFLARQQARFPRIDLLRATNPQGETIYGRGVDPAQRASLAQRDYYRRLQGDATLGMVFAEPIIGKISQRWIWLMARRLNRPDGTFDGLVYASLFIDELAKSFAGYQLVPDSAISLRDGSMRLVAHSAFGRPAALPIGDSRITDAFQQALTLQPRAGTYVSGTGEPDGIGRLYAYQRSDRHGFILQVGIPRSHVMAIWLQQSSVVVALLITALVALRLLARNMARKLDAEMEQQAQDVRESERTLLKSLVQTLPSLLWLKDPQGTYIACNPEFERFFGHSEQEIVGRTDADFMPKEVAESFRAHDQAAMAAGMPTVNEEWITYASDGHRALLATTKTPMYRADGSVLGVMGIAHDITPLRAAQQELERHRQKLEQLVQERTADVQAANQMVLDTQFAMDKVGIGIMWVEPHTGRFLYSNNYHANVLGYTPEEVLQLSVPDIDPNFPAEHLPQIVEEIRSKGWLQFETTQRGKQGQVIHAEMTIYHHAGSDETGARLIAFMTDITRRKEHEHALLAAKQSAEAASAANAALVVQLEAANRRLAMSDQRLTAMFAMSQKAPDLQESALLRMGVDEAVRLTGSQIGYLHFVNDDQETITMQTWSSRTLEICEATHEDHYPVSSAGVWADAVRKLRPVVHNDFLSLEKRRGYPNGHAHLLRHAGIPVIDGGKVRLLLGVGNKEAPYDESDVSELQLIGNDLWSIIVRRRAESALVEAKKAAESATVAKSAFLANMSHEIRTPLNAITGMAHLIRRSGISAEQGERLDKIERAGQHLLEIINAVLDLSKIEAGKFVLDESEVDLVSVVENVASILGHQAQSKRLEVRIDNRLTERKFMADATRLQQGLLNYGSNAIKFSEVGPVTLRVLLVEGGGTSALVRFEVEDHGIGIEAANLEKLFSAFEQADNSTTRRYGGTGLGLAITKKIAQLMGGDAGASSRIGVGSTFWFTARLRKSALQPQFAPSNAGVPAETILARDFRSARVLLVEDEPINREITLMLLGDIWPVVDVAEDGLVAVERATGNGYDLILMDMQMPRLDGLEATRRIRQIPGRQDVPIVAMTANAFAEDRQRCIAAGMNDFLAKPTAPEALFEVILKWLRR